MDKLEQYKTFGIYVGCLVYNKRHICKQIGEVIDFRYAQQSRNNIPVLVKWEGEQEEETIWSFDLIKV